MHAAQGTRQLQQLCHRLTCIENWGLTMGLAVVLHEVSGDGINLHGQLPGGGNHNGACAIAGHELGPVQQLQAGHQEGQRLARACKYQPICCQRTKTC